MIGAAERDALTALSFDVAPTPDEIWRPSLYDVPELHERVAGEILSGVNRARTDDNARPLGVAMQGRAGSGKTHLLGAVRDRIQRESGYFFLVNLINGRTFWESVALGIVEGMGKDAIGWGSQLKTFLRRLTAQLGIPAEVRDAVAGNAELTRSDLDTFIHALRRFDREVGRDCQDTARALALLACDNFEAQDVGQAHLISEPGEATDRATWGMSAAVRPPQLVVRDVSRLIALTLCPTVIAFDQLDTLFAQTSTAMFARGEQPDAAEVAFVGPITHGLLTLRDTTQRTLLVVSCLPDVWALVAKAAPAPVTDRFREAVLPDRISTPEIGRAIVAKRFAARYAERRFTPPHPTWPIAEQAFADAVDLTPRTLLRRVDRHIQWCLYHDELIELARLTDSPTGGAERGAERPPAGGAGGDRVDLSHLDRQFGDLVATADVSRALDSKEEDSYLPPLLAAGLASWIDEQSPTGATFKYDPLPGAKPALHGRLIQVLDEATENEAHWAFRGIASTNAVAVISRVRSAHTKAGLDLEIPQRRLVVLRRGPWPSGKRTKEVTDAFLAAGGILHPIAEADLKVFAALAALRANPDRHLKEWLLARRPASTTAVFGEVLGDLAPRLERRPDAGAGPPAPAPPIARGVAAVPAAGSAGAGSAGARVGGRREDDCSVLLGRFIPGGDPLILDLESLRRHCVIFAGSGSGKTVLIRRLVEECARKGVSAIVLDPNNDLARLGDAWPELPDGWAPGDADRARDYLDHTEVVVWTPRISGGRPLAFQPLPDFGPVRESPDELDQAIESAVEALAPRAGVNGATRAARQGKAVLTETLRAYAKQSSAGLRGFVDFLHDLPNGVSWMTNASKLAHDAAETLKAAMVTDPLFGGAGAPADPGRLLAPSPGKRARVSVISFVGLSSDEQRQSFVNQLQMALFNWIKRNPAGDRPLGGLFVMDEAQTLAPASGKTPCTASSIALASQARKYGLGLVFATQAPKGLHNQISGNATTQFFGLLNSPAQIDAARHLAEAKGGRLPDIGLLTSGQFYAAGDGFSFVKVATPLCLTHHPKAPLTPEEVLSRARADALPEPETASG